MKVAKDLIVLSAINNGAKQFDKISKVTKITSEELTTILEKLENHRFISIQEKKGWLGKKLKCILQKKEIEN